MSGTSQLNTDCDLLSGIGEKFYSLFARCRHRRFRKQTILLMCVIIELFIINVLRCQIFTADGDNVRLFEHDGSAPI